MKNEVAAIAVVVTLLVGVVVGYLFIPTPAARTTSIVSETTVTHNSTFTTANTMTVTWTEATMGQVPSITSIETGNTSISGSPDEVAVNPATNMLYIADMFSGNLTVVNGSSGKVTGTIVLPPSAEQAGVTGIAVDSDTNTIFVSTSRPAIFAIDGSTNEIIRFIPVDATIDTVDPSRQLLYATQGQIAFPNSTGSLLVLSEVSGSLIANVSLNGYPSSVVLNPATNLLYVPACQSWGPVCHPVVLVVNGTTNRVSVRISIPGVGYTSFVLDPSSNHAYLIVDTGVTELVSIDLNTYKTNSSVIVESNCNDMWLIGINPSRGELYATVVDPGLDLFLVMNLRGNIVSMFSTLPKYIANSGANPAKASLYLTLGPSSSQEKLGFLISLPENFTHGFVDTDLIASGICMP